MRYDIDQKAVGSRSLAVSQTGSYAKHWRELRFLFSVDVNSLVIADFLTLILRILYLHTSDICPLSRGLRTFLTRIYRQLDVYELMPELRDLLQGLISVSANFRIFYRFYLLH